MIQYYLDLENQVKVLKDNNLTQGQIQKIYSTSFYISITVRALGKNWHILIGRGGGYEGLWLSNKAPSSVIRRKDTFLEYLRKHLSSCGFMGISLDHYDRIIKLDYQKFGQINSLLWFWKGRQLYFLHHFVETPGAPFKILKSWRSKHASVLDDSINLFEQFNEVGRNIEMSHDFSTKDLPKAEMILLEEENLANIQVVKSAPQFLLRKKEKIKEDLRRANQWEKLQFFLDNGKPTEDIYELKIDDQKIKFDGNLNSFERRNLIHNKIKKLKKGVSILTERLNLVEEDLKGRKTSEKRSTQIPIIKPVWGDEKKITAQKVEDKSATDFKVFSYQDIQFGVGLNAYGNDQLRNKWSNKNDHWVHLDGIKSAHVVVKLPEGEILSADVLNFAASIVARFSQYNNEWIPIIHTQVKNLKGVTGSPGMVIFKKEKHLRCQNVSLEMVIKD
jgi:predicted ribosome quality control (RQC) complex YloA/Tae2 family protein